MPEQPAEQKEELTKEEIAVEKITKRMAAVEVVTWANKVKLVGTIAVVGGILSFTGIVHPIIPTISSGALILAGGYFFATSKQTVEHLTKKYLE